MSERLGGFLIILTFILFELSLMSIAFYPITKIIIGIVTLVVATGMIITEFRRK